MRTGWTTGGLVLALLLFAGCGGGGGDAAAPAAGVPVVSQAPAKNLVVVRLDHDGDGNPDLLTLDVDRRPLAIVEALRGTEEGKAVDASAELAGLPLAPEIEEALLAHLADSFALDAEADLEVVVGGETRTVTVIE